MSGLEKAGCWLETLALLGELQVQKDVITYSAAVSACENTGEWFKAGDT